VAWLVDQSIIGLAGVGILALSKARWRLLVNRGGLVVADVGTEFTLAAVLTQLLLRLLLKATILR
jgi:hypothetical protein